MYESMHQPLLPPAHFKRRLLAHLAVASGLLAVSLAAGIAWWLMAREERRRQYDMQMALQQG